MQNYATEISKQPQFFAFQNYIKVWVVTTVLHINCTKKYLTDMFLVHTPFSALLNDRNVWRVNNKTVMQKEGVGKDWKLT